MEPQLIENDNTVEDILTKFFEIVVNSTGYITVKQALAELDSAYGLTLTKEQLLDYCDKHNYSVCHIHSWVVISPLSDDEVVLWASIQRKCRLYNEDTNYGTDSTRLIECLENFLDTRGGSATLGELLRVLNGKYMINISASKVLDYARDKHYLIFESHGERIIKR